MNTNHLLYYYTSPEELFRMLATDAQPATLPFRAGNLLYTLDAPGYTYGLELLREAIRRYELLHSIPAEKSKSAIPFFRTDRLKLVGPEPEMYFLSFYESEELFSYGEKEVSTVPGICLGVEYDALIDYCLFENASLFPCGYEKETAVASFVKELELEYDKFDFDAEHTLFYKGSRFASLLYAGCSKWKEAFARHEKEWRLTTFKMPEDALFLYEKDAITPYVELALPVCAIRSVGVRNIKDPFRFISAVRLMLEKRGIDPGTLAFEAR